MLSIPKCVTDSKVANSLGKSLSGLWHREVSDDSQQRKQMFRAIVSKVLVMRGLSVAHW